MSLKSFRLDLHVHTCLSPCGDARMIPEAIVKAAVDRELDAVCITDHNSAENVQAVMAAARDSGITVLPGMEMTSSEEAHLLGIFDDLEAVLELQGRVYSRLPGVNSPDRFGHQWIVDSQGYVDGESDKLLIGATEFDFDQAVALIKSLGGLAIAAHVDREAFSVIGQLGFIPPSADLDAVEVKAKKGASPEQSPLELYNGLPEIRASDAHFLDAIGLEVTVIAAQAATAKELGMALKGQLGRKVQR